MWKNFFRNKEHIFKLWQELLENPNNSSSYIKLKDFYKDIGMDEQSKMIGELSCVTEREINNIQSREKSNN